MLEHRTLYRIVLCISVFILVSCRYFDPLNPFPKNPGQIPVTWQVNLGGTGEDVASSVQQTSDGGYILTGYTNSYGAGDYDLWLVKTDSLGGEEWSQTFGGTDDDYGYSGQQTPDGGYIVAGSTRSYGAGGQDVYLIKTYANGDLDWSKTFGGSLDDCGTSVQCTNDGGYIITGETFSFGTGSSDVYLIKTDGSGNLQWSSNVGADNCQESSSCIRQTGDGGYIISGIGKDLSNSDDNACLMKIDSSGTLLWSKSFGRNDLLDGGTGVLQIADGGYILCGYTRSFGEGDFDAWLIKTDGSGKAQWSKTFGADRWDQADAVQQTTDGGYVLAGMTKSYEAWKQAWLIKTDAVGKLEWSKTFGGNGDEYALSVQQTAEGGYIIAGKTSSFGASATDVDAYLIYYKP